MKHSDGGWGHMLTVICFPPSCAPSHHLCFKDGAQTTLTLIRKEEWLKTRQQSWNNTSKLRDIFPATLLIISPLLTPNSVKKNQGEVCCYKWLRFICALVHTEPGQVHTARRGVSGIPLGLGLSHLSWWMSGLPDCTFSFHFLPGCAEALPPTVRCHFFNPFSIHMKCGNNALSHSSFQ